jgi:RNA polymerase sigma-70 factor (ECF subfamily)
MREAGRYVVMSHDPSTLEPHRLHVQQLFVRHQPALLAYVLSLEPSYADAQDIVQEVFLAVSRKADSWSAGTNFTAWVYAIARFEVLHFQRRRARGGRRLDEEVVELLHATVDLPDVDDFEQRLQILQGCLQQLAPRARELILLRYHQGYKPERIATIVGWSINAVRVALTRARQSLRRCLEKRWSLESR